MNGSIHVEFQPAEGTVPLILAAIGDEGFPLRGIRLLPSFGATRSTLRVDIGGWRSPDQIASLENRLSSLDETIEVIHRAAHA